MNPRLITLVAGTALLAAPALSAATAEKTLLEAGLTSAIFDVSGARNNLAGVAVAVQTNVAEVLIFDAAVRGSYRQLESTDGSGLAWRDGDVDGLLSGSLLGLLAPYVSAGFSCDQIKAASYTPGGDWELGVAFGAGVEITLLPGLLHTTPAVRYVDGDDLDTVTYSLDTQFHLAILAVGLRLAYEDNQSRAGELASALVYAAFRF